MTRKKLGWKAGFRFEEPMIRCLQQWPAGAGQLQAGVRGEGFEEGRNCDIPGRGSNKS